SGATHHLCSKREWFTEYRSIPHRPIHLADDRAITDKGVGTIQVRLNIDGKYSYGYLQEVLFVPDLRGNLLSVNQMTNRNLRVIFDDMGCKIRNKDGHVVAKAIRARNLYKLVAEPCVNKTTAATAETGLNGMTLWHRRLGHLGIDQIRLLSTRKLVSGLEVKTGENLELCKGCVQGKQHRLPFSHSEARRADEILGIVHSDISGAMNQVSLEGAKYFVTFIDDKSRKTFVYFLNSEN